MEFTYDVVSYGDDKVVFLVRLANDNDPYEDRFDTIQQVKDAIKLGENTGSDVIYFSSELLNTLL